MKHSVGHFTIDHEHPALAGHFPDHPVVPGVVLLDHAMDLLESAHGRFDMPVVLPRVKFLRPVLPGQTVQVSSEQAGARVVFTCEVDGGIVIDGQFEIAS